MGVVRDFIILLPMRFILMSVQCSDNVVTLAIHTRCRDPLRCLCNAAPGGYFPKGAAGSGRRRSSTWRARLHNALKWAKHTARRARQHRQPQDPGEYALLSFSKSSRTPECCWRMLWREQGRVDWRERAGCGVRVLDEVRTDSG